MSQKFIIGLVVLVLLFAGLWLLISQEETPETDSGLEIVDEIEENDLMEDTMIVSLFFGRLDSGEELVSVQREIPFTEGVARAALLQLIEGPTETQRQEGYFSSINENTGIQSLSIVDGVAYVDFSSDLEEGVAGSATVFFIRSQIEETLKQFETVDDVVISINGRTEDILQP